MTTLYDNVISGVVDDNPLSSGATTLTSSALANLSAVTGSDIMWITLDPDATAGAPEIVKVTAHTASATTATITRAQQGSTARAHLQNTVWKHTVTATDLDGFLTTVVTANITDLNVTTGKIAADAITGAKIADDQIDSEHYVDGSIDAAHLADDAVTTAKILDANVTEAKLAPALLEKVLFTDDNMVTWDPNCRFGSDESNITVSYAKYQYTTAGRVYGEIELILTGTPGSGNFQFDLPVTGTARHSASRATIGHATLLDSGTDWTTVHVVCSSTTVASLDFGSTVQDFVRTASPFTWGTDDEIHLYFEYPIT